MKTTPLTTTFLSLITSIFPYFLVAQCYIVGINSQSDVDNFATIYPGCTQVYNLQIKEANGPIYSLNGLSQITTITNNLIISNTNNLTDLSGLDSLTSIGNYLTIEGTVGLTDFSGLNQLTSVGGSLNIWGTSGLTSLSGLENLTSLEGELSVLSAEGLTSISGLSGLTSFDQDISICTNNDLTSISAFPNISTSQFIEIMFNPNLERITGFNDLITVSNLTLLGNPKLFDITGFSKLNTVYGYLDLVALNSLKDLKGLENLTTVEASIVIGSNDSLSDITALIDVTVAEALIIYDNTALNSLHGLDNIDPTGMVSLSIHGNSNLSVCGIPSICAYLLTNGHREIWGYNATNCNSEAEILATCSPTSINDIKLSSKVGVFPNPNNGLFELRGIKTGSFTIFDAQGKEVHHGSISNNRSFDLSPSPNGLYLISVKNGKQDYSLRVVKM